MTSVLALDLSIRATGICTPDGGLSTFRPKTERDDRLWEITQHITGHLFDPRVELAVIEDLPPARAGSTASLGMLHGAVRYQLISCETPYLLVTPAQLKTYATGKGTAQKPDLRMELYKRTEMDIADDNQVDAWFLRALALDLAGEPVLALPQTHRRALAKLTLPIGATP